MISGFAYLFFLIILAITPSLVWLNYYLKKDPRPEPQHKLISTFVMGILITIFVGFLELIINKTNFYKTLDNETRIIIFLLLFPLLEEIGKFLATFLSTRKNPFFKDETTDPIIYAIVAGLGFAAAENLKVCFSVLQENLVTINWDNVFSFTISSPVINTLIITIFIRFLTAVFLHANSSAIFGYFWAVGRILKKNKRVFISLIILGIIIASILHSCYNYLILKVDENINNIWYIIILLTFSNYIMSRLIKQVQSYQKIYGV